MTAKKILIGLLVLVTGGTIVLITAQGLAQRGIGDRAHAGYDRQHNETSQETPMSEINSEFAESAKEELTKQQYNVCFLKGTEPPGSGEYYKHFEPGTYHCAVCREALFDSETKYDSGSGWPAFYDAVNSDAVATHVDTSHGMRRVEITCANCGSHLGHVFDDGPAPTHQRYCVNSLSLEFVAENSGSTE